MRNKKAKLLYITSLGHSGSTLLDLLCGTIPGVFSLGEAHYLSWQLLQGEKEDDPQTYCSCGKYFDKCSFWGPILRDINSEEKVDVFEKPKDFTFSLNKNIDRYNKSIAHKILNKLYTFSYSKKSLWPVKKLIYWIYLPAIKRCWRLYDKAAQKANCEYVVDSSKDINRFLLLFQYRPKNIKLIILKRDLMGVASSSHAKLTPELIKERAFRWERFYRQITPKVIRTLNNDCYENVSYESMCRDHESIRNGIAKFLGLNISGGSIHRISPYNYHTIQGNPIRLKKCDLKISYDERWRQRLSQKQIEWLRDIEENF